MIFARPDVDERSARRQPLQKRALDELRDAVDEEERDRHADGHRDAGTNQAQAELVQMIEKSHLAAGVLFGRLRG